jgi:hypothetical protein
MARKKDIKIAEDIRKGYGDKIDNRYKDPIKGLLVKNWEHIKKVKA